MRFRALFHGISNQLLFRFTVHQAELTRYLLVIPRHHIDNDGDQRHEVLIVLRARIVNHPEEVLLGVVLRTGQKQPTPTARQPLFGYQLRNVNLSLPRCCLLLGANSFSNTS